ncbi:MAG TPA: hypothetical protein VFH31_11480 [Pyrinomonadaceae bacterium]|nr:hypothetical protein [Pyrinomonadaceae bacterium]
MKPITQPDLSNNVFQLLKEAFEGPPSDQPSAFLNKGTGLFQTLNEITAQAASAQTRPGGSTIAAHTEHLRFYVMVHYELLRGSTEKIDWAQSWRVRHVTSAEWDQLRRELRRAYKTVTEHLRAVSIWSDDEISVGMAIIAHTAYHLGAIRQLMLAVNP